MKARSATDVIASQVVRSQDKNIMALVDKHVKGHFDKVDGGYRAKPVPAVWNKWGIVQVLSQILNPRGDMNNFHPTLNRVKERTTLTQTNLYESIKDVTILDKDMDEIKAAIADSGLEISKQVMYPTAKRFATGLILDNE